MITSGTITFEQRVNDGDFQHRMARAEITFTTDKGDGEAYAERARIIAEQKVAASLARQSSSPSAPVEVPPPAADPVKETVQEDPGFPESDNVGAEEAVMPTPRKPRSKKVAVEDVEKPIPDVVLRNNCSQAQSKAVSKGKGLEVREAILALITRYAGPTGKTANIPDAKRQAFLDELAQL